MDVFEQHELFEIEVLEKNQRDYYIENGFAFLNARLNAALDGGETASVPSGK